MRLVNWEIAIDRQYVVYYWWPLLWDAIGSLGVQLYAKLSWKIHIEYITMKLTKCAGICIKAKKKLSKPYLFSLWYSFAYPYLMYSNHDCGHNYPNNLDQLLIMQNQLIRLVTCAAYLSHPEPPLYANKILAIKYINIVYDVSVFMYNCVESTASSPFY